jgi:site-specific recombinase XerD
MKSSLDPEDNPGLFSGPLRDHVGTYTALLAAQGYKRPTLYPDTLLLADLDEWMRRSGWCAEALDEAVLERFLIHHMRTRSARRRAKRASLLRLLAMLRKIGVAAVLKPAALSPVEQKLWDYTQYLGNERGCVPTTIAGYRLPVRRLLHRIYGDGPVNLRSLSAPAVLNFIRHHVQRHGRLSAPYLTNALRSYFRFLRHRGEIAIDLGASVPSVAGWSLAGLPRHLPRGTVRRVLAGQERMSPAGRRDYAILLLLARLGLRSCEVAALRLEDIDWEGSCINIRSRKGGRTIALPLPGDVGRALAKYLKAGRPACACREVFVSNRAPLAGISRISVGHVARRAMLRSGIKGVSMGSHTFRHTLASELLRRGASLDEIGRILRHKDPSTTAIYAKVDMDALRPLAMRWPGGVA